MHFLERDERRSLKFEKFINEIEEPLCTDNITIESHGLMRERVSDFIINYKENFFDDVLN